MRSLLLTSIALLVGAASAQEATPTHWADRPLVRAEPAADLDDFVRTRLAQEGLRPSPEADTRTLVRRLYLTLHGLPPTKAELDAGVARCEDGRRGYTELVDELLASPRYAEESARLWLDVVRYSDTHGFETNTPRPNAWRYRDWVIDAFDRDLPYDAFVRAQLVGDATGEGAATGFLVAGPWDEVKSPDVRLTAEQRSNELADMVGTFGMTFLGVTLGCARCHDHKFDPVSQRDYYAVEAVFAGVLHGDRPVAPREDWRSEAESLALAARIAALDLELAASEPLADPTSATPVRSAVDPRRNVERFAPVRADAVRMSITRTVGGSVEPCIDELTAFEVGTPRNVAGSAAGAEVRASSALPGYAIHQVAHLNDGEEGNPRSWISNELGTGWFEIAFAESCEVDRVEWARDRTGRFSDRLPVEYRIELRVGPDTWVTVASSADRKPYAAGEAGEASSAPRLEERHGLAAARARLREAPSAYAGRFEQPGPTHRLHRGDAMSPREVVQPGGIAAFGAFALPADAPEQERRAALADWVTRADHPRTARVLVNRVWQQHFGTALAATPNDLGGNGAPPTHPEILDHLAAGLIADGWSVKALHKRIVMSATWRQSSQPDAGAYARDPDTKLLWRFPPRRLPAEVIRDAIVQASGELDPTRGGPGFDVFAPNDNYVRVYEPKTEFGADTLRRMVYARRVRMERDPTFGVFDCPDGGQSAPVRGRSTTALQALALRNSPFVLGRAEAMAADIRASVADVDSQVGAAFVRTLLRAPDATELDAAAQLVRDHGLAELCRALFNANEFLFLP